MHNTVVHGLGSSTSNNPQEAKGHDLKAADFYQKGIEIAHSATTTEEHLKSIELFSIAIAIRPNQPRFFFARGSSFRSINEFENAAKDFSTAISLDDRCALYYANRGACYRKMNWPIQSLEDFTVAIEMDTKKGTHFFNRALVLYENAFYQEAVLDFNKALEDGTGGPKVEYRALYSRGNCYRRLGNIQKCIEDTLAAIKLEPRNPIGYNYIAQAYFEKGDYDNAIVNYTNAIAASDTNPTFYTNRGICFLNKGDNYRESLMDFNTAIKLDGKDPQSYFYRGFIRLSIGLQELLNAGEGSSVLSPVSTNSSNYQSTENLATIDKEANAEQSQQGDSILPKLTSSAPSMSIEEQLEAAFSDIDMALSLEPHNNKFRIGMAMLSQLRKNHKMAYTLLNSVSHTDRSSVLVKYHLALSCFTLKDYQNALIYLTDVIEAIPGEVDFYETRALLFQELNAHDLAVKDYTQAIQCNPKNPRILCLRAESYLRLMNYRGAIEDCSSAIELDYRDPSVFNARAMGYRGLGLYDHAIEDLSKCLEIVKDNDIFNFHRGLCYMETGQYADAIPEFLISLQKNSEDARVLYFSGLCHFKTHRFRDSVEYFKKSLGSNPASDFLSELHYHLGLVYAIKNSNMLAIEHFTSAMNSTSNEKLKGVYIHERAKALQLERRYDEAIVDFSYVIQRNPNNAHAYFRRGFAYKAIGELTLAASDIQTARLLDPHNDKLVVNFKEISDIECIIICPPGEEVVY